MQLLLLSGIFLIYLLGDGGDEISRLVGHDVEVHDNGYTIRRIAGRYIPKVGCIEREKNSKSLLEV